MRKFYRLFFLALVILVFESQGFSALRSGVPAGVRSFSPTGTVPENVSFRVVFNNSVVSKTQTGKAITPENWLFPFAVNPPLQLEGQWLNERTFTAKLLVPLSNATIYTATLREGLKDRRGNRIGPGEFSFKTEELSLPKKTALSSHEQAQEVLTEKLIELGEITPTETLDAGGTTEINGTICWEFISPVSYRQYAISPEGKIYVHDGHKYSPWCYLNKVDSKIRNLGRRQKI